ncbi:response regulator transcription factor [Paenibacillus sp. P96]|uniref:Response regulator transcription factor n=1 Tax=Paenibacillus zeirhizosphaerae TaxID=2987519 RepID=A0ABT9FXI1_9BACL|nr:response regulator transcription factor [Paenibacillus sp. P96]MDP4099339.1 response regulator transcription factor [Paenibacillus sp. P96]
MGQVCRILVVDDETLVRQGIKHYLNWEQYGFEIAGEAANGREALELIETVHPHIVITDIVMPLMDGEEFTRVVKSRYPQIEIIVLSSYGEFEYVRSTFQSGVADYILKPKLETEELLRVLQKTARRIPSIQYTGGTDSHTVTMESLIGKLIASYDIEYDPDLPKRYFPYGGFCLLGAGGSRLSPKSASGGMADPGQELAASLQAGMEHIVVQPVPADSPLSVFLINVKQEDYAHLLAKVEGLVEASASRHPGYGWVISRWFSNFNELGSIFRDRLNKLIDSRFYFPEVPLLKEASVSQPGSDTALFDLKRFAEDMKREHYESAFQSLRDHVAGMAKDHRSSASEFRSFLGNIIFNITILLGGSGYDVKELDKAKFTYFQAIEEAAHVHEATAKLEDFLQEAGRLIALKQQQTGGDSMKMLLDYINDHYSEPLSLTALAKHFHFNPSYLSTYFAAHNTEGFSEYLNKVRVDKAAELLRSSTAPISEISSRVGYSDHSYFTKVFKKLTGSSPSQYRRQH